MLPKTDRARSAIFSFSGAALLFAVSVTAIMADERASGPVRSDRKAQPAFSYDFYSPEAPARPQVRQAAATDDSAGEATDAAGSEPAPELNVFIISIEEQADAEADAGRPEARYSNAERVDTEYSRRLHTAFSSFDEFMEFESVGEWWARRNQAPRHNLRQKVHQLVSGVVMQEVPEPDVDFYEASPIIRTAAPVESVASQEAPPADEPSSLSSSRRLRTDIRTIKPSLSYALKNVDRSQLPDDYDEVLDRGTYVARESSPTVLQWAPTNFYHYPLYFEDPALERYGHTYHPLVQPFASTGRFATQLIGLPYQMALHPVCEKQYALGYYRPGECAPKKHYQIPFNEEATVMQAAAIAGLILILP